MPSRRTPLTAAGAIAAAGSEPIEAAFAEVVGLIEQARQRAYQAVNTELFGLYWEIGRCISAKLEAAVWGEGVVDRLAAVSAGESVVPASELAAARAEPVLR